MATTSSGATGSQTSPTTRSGRTTVLATGVTPAGASVALAWQGHDLIALVAPFVLPLLVIVVVVGPAVWSRRPERRKAAVNVLDRLLGRHDAAVTGSRRCSPSQRKRTSPEEDAS